MTEVNPSAPTGEGQPPSLLEQVTGFSRALRRAGVRVNAGDVIDLCRCFDYIDVASKADFYNAACATLVSNREDVERFEAVFAHYWTGARRAGVDRHPGLPGGETETGTGGVGSDRQVVGPEDACAINEAPRSDVASSGASDRELLLRKDLRGLDAAETETAREAIRELAAALVTDNSLRRRAAPSGNSLDQRRLLRETARRGGHIARLPYKRRKPKKAKLFLLCDVSGTMDQYAGFLIQFVRCLRRELPAFEAAVFSTRLSVITPYLEDDDLQQALAMIGDHVQGWSGGTTIGECLRQFNWRFADDMSHSRSIALVLSDGWDRGDAGLLRRELQALRRRVHRLIWLNPRLAEEGYQPLARGMRTALPYLDEFLPFNNIESLKDVALALRRNCSN